MQLLNSEDHKVNFGWFLIWSEDVLLDLAKNANKLKLQETISLRKELQ